MGAYSFFLGVILAWAVGSQPQTRTPPASYAASRSGTARPNQPYVLGKFVLTARGGGLGLRGGMGIAGTTYPDYCEMYDGNPKSCKCMPGCRCSHCNERTGFARTLKSKPPVPPHSPSYYDRGPYPTLTGAPQPFSSKSATWLLSQ